MKRQPEIVSIGQGLCRLTVRTRKQREFYARIPGVRIDDREAEYMGYRVLFPEKMRGLIESTIRKEKRRETQQKAIQTQLSLQPKEEGGQGRKAGVQGSRGVEEGKRRKTGEQRGRAKPKKKEGA